MTSLRRKEHLPILFTLSAALVIGALIAPHYGESWDEMDIYRYSAYALGAYRYLLHPASLPAFDTNLNLYGPGYFMVANVLARGIAALAPSWELISAWHFVYFVTFLGGAAALYVLANRWMSPLGAFGTSLLFLAQPLLWGHAFINPKDLPFLVCFMSAVTVGLKMIDDQHGSRGLAVAVLPAGLLLGLTSSFRIVGPLAGVIVLGYAAYQLRAKAFPVAVAYSCIAIASAYLTWPYIWIAPASHYLESLQTMAQFPFDQKILFGGRLYTADHLPRLFVPTLLSVQLTEPLIVLALVGIGLCILGRASKSTRGLLLLFAAWFLLPAFYVVVRRSPLYDNARQLYFLLPPIFLMAGFALDKVFAWITAPVARALVLLVTAMPGLVMGIRLHPYEYTYYNGLVGWTSGAYGQYEMDYWATSFRELATGMNSVAPQDARVLVYGPRELIAPYARSDILLDVPRDNPPTKYDLVAFLVRSDFSDRFCGDGQIAYSVGRAGAEFAVLKRIPVDATCN